MRTLRILFASLALCSVTSGQLEISPEPLGLTTLVGYGASGPLQLTNTSGEPVTWEALPVKTDAVWLSDFDSRFSSTLHNEVTERIPFSSTLDPAGRTAIEALFGSTYFDSEAGGNRITVGNQAINYYEETTNGGSAVYATARSDIFALTALMSNESSIGTSGVLVDHPGRVTDSASFTFQALGRTHRCQCRFVYGGGIAGVLNHVWIIKTEHSDVL